MKKILFPFTTLLLLIFIAGIAPNAHAATPKLEVSGWIPYWRTATGTADALAHLNSFTEINPFGYIVQPDGSLKDPMHIDQDPWATLISEAKKKKVRVIPTVMWSDTEAIHNILSNTSSRVALEDRITKLVKDNNFDGIDIDFEGKRAEDKNYFSTFLKGLYQRMGKKWVMCTIEARTPPTSRYSGTPPKDATVYANDYVAINKYCDRVRLMTYDQGTIDVSLNRARMAPYIPLADPGWVEKVINLTAQTISKKKLVVGVGTYGYEFEVTPLTEYGYRYDVQWAFNPRYATDLAKSLNIIPTRNSANEMSFTYHPAIQTPPPTDLTNTSPIPAGLATNSPAAVALATMPFNVLWWSDATAIKDKVDIAQRLGLKGVAIFKIDGGEDPNMWDILPRVR